MGVRSPRVPSGLAKARPPGLAKLAKAPLPGLIRQTNAPQLSGGGGSWAQLELTDALGGGSWAQLELTDALISYDHVHLYFPIFSTPPPSLSGG